MTTANPLYTAEELSHQLKDSNAKFIVTIGLFLEKAKEAAKLVGGAIQEIYVIGAEKLDGSKLFTDLLHNDGYCLLDLLLFHPALQESMTT